MEKRRIMLVEDEALVALKMKNDLLKMGHEVTGVYASGEEALEALRSGLPDLILMDIQLQGELDGIKTAGMISRDYDVPVIFLTAHSDDDTVNKATATAPYGYLLKPVAVHELQVSIQVATHKHMLDKEKDQVAKGLKKALEALPEVLLIIDGKGQVVHQNGTIFKMLKEEGFADEDCKLKQGKAFSCDRIAPMPDEDCVISKFCQACGFIKEFLDTQRNGVKSQRECKLAKSSGEALDVRITASPLMMEGESFTVITLEDISSERRSQALDRIFLHDIMNLAGGIQGISAMLRSREPSQSKPLTDMIETASKSLVEEIKIQRQLKLAEKGELQTNFEPMESSRFIKDIVSIYQSHEAAEGRTILEEASSPFRFESDRTLLMRVVGNMLKNALEATPRGGFVRIGCSEIENSGEVEFHIANDGFIPHELQAQIFKRAFSTKGEGHGLGTYSIKLLGERYLKGKVGFESDEKRGTTFHIRLKKEVSA